MKYENYEPTLVEGGLNLNSQMLVGNEDTSTAMLRVEIHPLPADDQLMRKLMAAMSEAALAVLRDEDIVADEAVISVFDDFGEPTGRLQ